MLMTATGYTESLRRLNLNPYLPGEKVENWVGHPVLSMSV